MNTNKEKRTQNFKNASLGVLLALFLAATTFAVVQYKQNTELEAKLAEVQAIGNVTAREQLEAYREIENNLANISMHEGNIRETANLEGVEDPQERIQAEIKAIETLMAENNKIIAELNQKVDAKDSRLTAYKRENGQLKTRLETYKDNLAQMEEINKQLASNLEQKTAENTKLQVDLQETNEVVANQEQALAEMDMKMHRAYYTVGEFKELKEKAVVNKDGGILGIAASKELNPKANTDQFTEIDIRFLKRIPVYKKNAEIVTPHDENSYEVVMEDNQVAWIQITNPELFWENSKYLVVVTKDGWM